MALVEDLQKQQHEVDRRLAKALDDAGRSALGMPGSVETLKAWLARAGLCLVLRTPEGDAGSRFVTPNEMRESDHG
ncbi:MULTISPECIES: hypothetical protein [unclassified Bradyrhizobium]|uniref:hypothetical protein n=1 Tax=unclassified Bradyrhizobium TaxID=2631580 RepID=UPI001FF9657D|nr:MULTISPECIES: hypothetical protein [unclassified Bradyrhizobium]MCK1536841.1 hypothetical protein [Bradyrhizobium sp. 176]MCK1560144.1 hypothetical protein [Bradyrhizobium sp. 171]